METLMEFTFSTEYLPGEKNTIANALSRCHESVALNSVSLVEEKHRELLWEAELRGLKYLEENNRSDMIIDIHSLGHFGAKHIASKIREQGYWWPGMLRNIDKQIHSCQACLRFNIEKEGL